MTIETTPVAEAIEASTAADDKQGAKAETKGHSATPTNEDDPGPEATAETPADSEGDKPKKKGGGFQNRIDRLTREREEARAEASALRKQVEGKSTVVDTAKDDPEPVRPKESDFKDWDTYEQAKEEFIASKAVWKARQEVRTKVQEHETKQATEKVAESRREAVRKFEKQAGDLADTHEGLDEAVERFFSDKTMPISAAMAEYIMEVSDRGPELVFALDGDLDEAERISKLNPLAAARELARLEAKLPKPEARKVSSAPKPTIVPKGSAESPVKKLEEMSNAEYKAFRNKQDQAEKNFRPNVRR